MQLRDQGHSCFEDQPETCFLVAEHLASRHFVEGAGR